MISRLNGVPASENPGVGNAMEGSGNDRKGKGVVVLSGESNEGSVEGGREGVETRAGVEDGEDGDGVVKVDVVVLVEVDVEVDVEVEVVVEVVVEVKVVVEVDRVDKADEEDDCVLA